MEDLEQAFGKCGNCFFIKLMGTRICEAASSEPSPERDEYIETMVQARFELAVKCEEGPWIMPRSKVGRFLILEICNTTGTINGLAPMRLVPAPEV